MMHAVMVILAGAVGTTAMVLVTFAMRRLRIADADMVGAIGSLLTRSERKARGLGFALHYAMGIFFAGLYVALIALAPIPTRGAAVMLAGFAGLVHGIWIGLFLTIAVAEHHPVEKFRRSGIDVAIAHAAGHVFYGLGVGAVLAWIFFDTNAAPFSDLAASREILVFSAIWAALIVLPIVLISLNLRDNLSVWSNPPRADSPDRPFHQKNRAA